MRKTQTTKDFQVAILMDDVVEAKAVSDSLREIGIFAHYYQELDDLWVSLNTYTPDLCIVDVTKMSQGTLLFKNHAKVKSHSLKFCFYYKDETKFLMNSCFGLNHYGFVRAELDLLDQLKCILRRRNEELRLIEQNETMEGRIERLKLRGQRLTDSQELNDTQIKHNNEALGLTQRFGRVNSIEDFEQRLITVFSQWVPCLDFGVYKLNSTHQKLVSPKKRISTYRTLPDLWLTSPCENGIEDYAAEMAFDVCYGLIDGKLVALRIEGINDGPDMLLIAHFDEEQTKHIDWSIIENKLSSEYRRAYANHLRKDERAGHKDSIFSTLQAMDDVSFHKADSNYRYAMVDFSHLVNMIKQRSGNRFYWQAFANEFENELLSFLSGETRISTYGAEYFVVAIDKTYIEADYHKLKAFVEDFQFWRYFEDSTLVVASDLAPTVKFLAPSSVNLIRQAHDETSDFMQMPQNPIRERQIEV